MALETRILKGAQLEKAIPDLARLRIEVFAKWPYLYDGDLAYEAEYLRSYQESEQAIVVAIFDGRAMVGCATGTPMEDHAQEFAAAFSKIDVPPQQIFYCAESVLMPAYRGQGVGHVFFDEREAHARALGRKYSAFCGVIRDDDDPRRPADYRPLDGFWKNRGYAKRDGAIAHFKWKEQGGQAEVDHELQFWMRELT